MKKQTLQLSFGCLLHDIGKPVFRAGGSSGTHSRLGYDALRALWPEESDILDCVRYHHAAELRSAKLDSRSPAWICCAADNLSAAADRREIEGENGSFRRMLPLSSIFTHLNGEHPGYSVTPRQHSDKLRMPRKGAPELSASQYQATLSTLLPRLAELPRTEAWLDSLLCLLENHLSEYPSSTNTGESPDISLFDHLKTTAGIGACISEYLLAEGETDYKTRLFTNEARFRDEKAFLLYSADFSGIQSFIYSVASDKALRSLRSHSFFLEFLMEHYADELLQCCGVSRANLLYTGGGHCYALLPNTPETVAQVKAWNRRFNDWLSEQFGVSLFLAHGWTECSGNELTNTPAEQAPYKAMFRRVSSAVNQHKLHRYDAGQLRMLNRPAKPGSRECKVCGRTERLRGDRCEWCTLFVELSDHILNEDIYFVSENEAAEHDFVLPTPDGSAYICLTDEASARRRLEQGEAVRRIYSKNKAYTGLQYSTRIYVGDYVYSPEMETLARTSSGVHRIGVCRMDVDNLGQAFVAGFEKAEKKTAAERQHFVTLSRTSAFSRQMSLFFKYYIKELLDGSFENKDALAVTVVYSGGDDVFLVGAWDDTIEAARRIRNALREYSCGALTISAGICVTDDHFPIRLAAAQAGELEDAAKAVPQKDAVCLFEPSGNHSYSWQRFQDEVMGVKLSELKQFFDREAQERGTAFLYKLVDLLRLAQQDGKMHLARYAYLLARLSPKPTSKEYDAYRRFADNMYTWALDEKARAALITAIYIYVYENRKVEK